MGFIYSIQICEISYQTFWPSHRKCPTCLMIFVNTGAICVIIPWVTHVTLSDVFLYPFVGRCWNLLYLSRKWCDCHETKSKHIDWTLGLKCDHPVWHWPWPWPWPWIYKVKYRICYISAKKWSDCHETNFKQIFRLKSRPQMWLSDLTLAMTLTLTFQDQIWNLLYFSQKWSDCHKMKNKCISWTLGLKWVWPWAWPWPWIFNVNYGICYILW